jgi:hypothetical protein
MLSNELECKDSRVLPLLSGKDNDWSSSLRKALEKIDENNVFFLLEDAFLCKKVNNDDFLSHYKFFINNNVNYLRLRPAPKPDVNYNEIYGAISNNAMYRVSLFASFWKKDVLLDVLKDGESAWQFEVNGSERSVKYDKFFSAYSNFFSIVHGVERGKWINSSYRKMVDGGYVVDSRRPMLYASYFEEVLLTSSCKLKHSFINLFPASHQQKIINVLGNIKRKIFGRFKA